ncbi:MAG: alkaline phosphatase [Colwellia sp.]|nr:alkaline phosphatase [Colwellia sp.]
MRHFLPILLLSLSTASCVSTESSKQEVMPKQNAAPKNIIMVIGDGMGPAYTTAYRYFSDNPKTEIIEETIFDRHLKGLSSTYPAAVSGVVTDSAASATALATGIKSYNGAISVDVNKNSVQTVLEWAKLQGKATGVVVTSQINHATPAAYLTHNESRKNYNAIANSYIDNGIKADLYFGGGWQYFIREDRNIVNEFKQAGFHYFDNYQGLTNLPNNKPVLGLFANIGLPWALDDTNKHRLSAMTKAAVHHLVDYQESSSEKKHGFFMLIEASQIDWAGHVNDVSNAMAEMDDLARTLEYLEHFVEHHPDTLVIVTADHSTGGLTLGANGKYEWQPEKLRSMQHSPTYIAKQLIKNEISPDITTKLFNFELSSDDIELLIHSKNTAVINNDTKIQKLKGMPILEFSLSLTVKKIINKYSNTGWTSGGHTAIDVPVFAFGKQSELFNGQQDNIDIAKKIFLLLGR